jgi:hypothetical protein
MLIESIKCPLIDVLQDVHAVIVAAPHDVQWGERNWGNSLAELVI